MYKVKYQYLNPSRSGPFRGHCVQADKQEKGDEIYACFGRAVVVSCYKVKVKQGLQESQLAK